MSDDFSQYDANETIAIILPFMSKNSGSGWNMYSFFIGKKGDTTYFTMKNKERLEKWFEDKLIPALHHLHNLGKDDESKKTAFAALDLALLLRKKLGEEKEEKTLHSLRYYNKEFNNLIATINGYKQLMDIKL